MIIANQRFPLLFGLLLQPHMAVQAIAQAGRFRTPLLLAGALSLAIGAGVMGDLAAAADGTRIREIPPALIWAAASGGLVCIVLLTWGVQALLLTGVGRWGSTPLRPAMALRLAPWLWLPLGIRLAVHRVADSIGVERSGNGLTGIAEQFGQSAPILRQILWQCDFFLLWHLVLVGITLYTFTRPKASQLVDGLLAYGLCTLLFQAVLTLWAA